MENISQKHPLNAKKIALFVLYGIIALCLLFAVLSFNDLPAIFEALRTVKQEYVALAFLSILVYIAIYPLSLCILSKARGLDVSLTTTYVIGSTEHFFNCITPLATGGQPFQAHSLYRLKVKVSESTGLLLANLLVFMISTTLYSLAGLLFWRELTAHVDVFWKAVIVVGYSLNLLVTVLIFTLGASVRLREWLIGVICFVARFKPFSWLKDKAEGARQYFEQVQEAFGDLTRKKSHFLIALLTKVFAFAFLYGSTYFAVLSMGVAADAAEIPLILFGASFAITAVGFVPTPGASGGVEGAAGQVFKSVIIILLGTSVIPTAHVLANGVMLIWRLASYYFVIAVSLLFYIGLEVYLRKNEKRSAIRKEADI